MVMESLPSVFRSRGSGFDVSPLIMLFDVCLAHMTLIVLWCNLSICLIKQSFYYGNYWFCCFQSLFSNPAGLKVNEAHNSPPSSVNHRASLGCWILLTVFSLCTIHLCAGVMYTLADLYNLNHLYLEAGSWSWFITILMCCGLVASTPVVCGLCLLEIVVSNCILCICSCLVLVLR